jgi:hypothetical protein
VTGLDLARLTPEEIEAVAAKANAEGDRALYARAMAELLARLDAFDPDAEVPIPEFAIDAPRHLGGPRFR